MYHQRGDGNGASSSFFWVPPDVKGIEQSVLARLNSRFAAFAHVVEGADILLKLRPSDRIVSMEVVEGAWELLETSPLGSEYLPATV